MADRIPSQPFATDRTATLLETAAATSPPKQASDEAGSGKRLKKSAFFGSNEWIDRIYGKGRREKIAELTNLYPCIISPANFKEHAAGLSDLEVVFTTWGFGNFPHVLLEGLSSLTAIFYAGGTVRSFAEHYLKRNIILVSAWQANAVPVAEFALAQILLSTKGYFRNMRELSGSTRPKDGFSPGRGNFGETVAILGVGACGARVVELLKHFELRVIVFDPFLTDEKAALLGVEKVSLETAFDQGYVVSNHLANVEETKGLLRGDLFGRMRPDATFINTGRGETVDESGMISALKNRPDLTVLLDVTHPEPPVAGSPLYSMPNVFLSSHIAGSVNDELIRMGDYCIDEFLRFENNHPLRYAVSLKMFNTMA